MADETILNVDKREASGTSAVRRLRRLGLVPGVVYSDGHDAAAIQLERHSFEQMLRHQASESMILELNMADGSPSKVLLKDVQHHPLTGSVMHVDFQEIAMDKVLRVPVSVALVGEPIGVTRDGGTLEQHLREIEVECLPAQIAESIEFDVTSLEIGDAVTVADLDLDPDKYRVITEGDFSVANVVAPRVATAEEEEAEAAAAEGEEGAEGAAEPEVITEKKQDDEGGD